MQKLSRLLSLVPALVLATALSNCATKPQPPQVIERETPLRPVPSGLTLKCPPLVPLLISQERWESLPITEQMQRLTDHDTSRNKQYAECQLRHNSLVELDLVVREK